MVLFYIYKNKQPISSTIFNPTHTKTHLSTSTNKMSSTSIPVRNSLGEKMIWEADDPCNNHARHEKGSQLADSSANMGCGDSKLTTNLTRLTLYNVQIKLFCNVYKQERLISKKE